MRVFTDLDFVVSESPKKTEPIIVAALYQFRDLPEYVAMREPLLDFCMAEGLRGTLLLAHEGINGTVAGTQQGINALKQHLIDELGFQQLEYKESIHFEAPFHRIKVKLKKEIVTLGVPGVSPHQYSGQRLRADEWNSVISDPDVVVIDTRNEYEVDIGTFKYAVSPETETFREFPEYIEQHLDPDQHPKVAMFCTGGIRCEKASAYMLSKGFKEVYQLDGGILRYLEDMQEIDSENLWQGDCFVFDSRVAVDKNLNKGQYEQCFACRRPITDEDMQSSKYQQGVSCPNCFDSLDDDKRSRFSERQRQVELAEKRGTFHIGMDQNRRD